MEFTLIYLLAAASLVAAQWESPYVTGSLKCCQEGLRYSKVQNILIHIGGIQ